MKKPTEKSSVLIIALCWAVYTFAYVGRLNLNVYIELIRDRLGASKTVLGLVSSFSFFIRRGTGYSRYPLKKYNTQYWVAVV